MLTPNELAYLKAIDASEYGEDLTDEIWTFSIADHVEGLSGRMLSGTASSLHKKGYITSEDYEGSGNNDDHVTRMTPAGIAAFLVYVPKPKKFPV